MTTSGYVDPDGSPVLVFGDPVPLPVPAPPAAPAPATVKRWERREVEFVPPPSPGDLARLLGWPPLDVDQELSAQAHLDRAQTVVLTYTRGRGHYLGYLAEELAGVVLSLSGRSMANPTGDSRIEAGAYKSSPGQPEFTLTERLIMDLWRRRAA